MINPRTRLDDLETSPFKKYSDSDPTVNEWMLRNMCLSYSILKSMTSAKTNYFDEFEQYAVNHPELAEKLYIALRDHMNTSEKNHIDVYNDLKDIITPKKPTFMKGTAHIIIESSEESDDSYNYDHLM